MRRTVSLLISFVTILALTACGQSAASEKREEKQPVVQKTEEQTETSHSVAEADLTYYTNGRADQEQNDPDVRPAISGSVGNMDTYDTIILGYPNMEQGFESVLCA